MHNWSKKGPFSVCHNKNVYNSNSRNPSKKYPGKCVTLLKTHLLQFLFFYSHRLVIYNNYIYLGPAPVRRGTMSCAYCYSSRKGSK